MSYLYFIHCLATCPDTGDELEVMDVFDFRNAAPVTVAEVYETVRATLKRPDIPDDNITIFIVRRVKEIK